MARQPTKKQREFAKEYVQTGNGTQAVLKVYDTEDKNTAAMIASDNLRKPNVLALIEAQSEYAMLDQIAIREELKESKTHYAVRSDINKDILNRVGYKPQESGNNFIQVNIYDTDQQRRFAERILRDRETASQ